MISPQQFFGLGLGIGVPTIVSVCLIAWIDRLKYRIAEQDYVIEVSNKLFATLVTSSNAKYAQCENVTRRLIIAQSTLVDLVNQNHGDPQYHIWARKRASDTIDLIR